MNLRKLQFEAAKAGSVLLMIWLGRQWLHQRDEPEPERAGDALDELLAEFCKRHEQLKNADAGPQERE